MRELEHCDACRIPWAKVWWIGSPSGEGQYGWLELALCGHCSNLYFAALKRADWTIAVDERDASAFRPYAKKVPVHVS